MKKLIILCACLLICTNILTGHAYALSFEKRINFDYAYEIQALPFEIEQAIIKKLQFSEKRFNNNYSYTVISYKLQNNVALISIDVFRNNSTKHIADNYERTIVLVGNNQAGWEFVSDSEEDYAQAIYLLPEPLIAEEAKGFLLNQRISVQSTGSYKFPWPTGVSFYYNGDWHGTGDNAIDVGTTGADKRILASAGGTITSMRRCALTTRLYINDNYGNSLGYYHLNTATVPSGIQNFTTVTQGQYLGDLRAGPYNEPCGLSYQNSISAHLHWLIPNNGTFTVDGWSITYPNITWTKPGHTPITQTSYTPVLTSTNQLSSGDCSGQSNNVSISGVTVTNGSVFDCYAKQTIRIEPNFHAQTGSDVYMTIIP